MINKKQIVDIIINHTEFWQPYGEKDGCFIIETEDPFFWRISPRWAESTAQRIIEFLGKKKV